MRRAPSAIAAALVGGLTLAGGGCAFGGEEPPPADARAQEVADVVKALERATAEKDFTEVCFELFSDAVRARAGGVRCPARLRRSGGDIEAPAIEIRGIRLAGDTATAQVVTRARGQAPAPDAIELVRERGRWRISALGTAARGER